MKGDKPNVKHIETHCPVGANCPYKAFVQVVVVEDDETQKKIDNRALEKLTAALEKAHLEGAHDE